ncbi:unnamed protein product [Protopolystoma xenopodis]|uniref:Uncharacterized protein n=1 Tax=Protopolystoma xenopodis TaxID=117903 RepID=A0A448WJG1_9PLAT|nr:unnamed protein product [Protopolystoma xenopodis]
MGEALAHSNEERRLAHPSDHLVARESSRHANISSGSAGYIAFIVIGSLLAGLAIVVIGAVFIHRRQHGHQPKGCSPVISSHRGHPYFVPSSVRGNTYPDSGITYQPAMSPAQLTRANQHEVLVARPAGDLWKGLTSLLSRRLFHERNAIQKAAAHHPYSYGLPHLVSSPLHVTENPMEDLEVRWH